MAYQAQKRLTAGNSCSFQLLSCRPRASGMDPPQERFSQRPGAGYSYDFSAPGFYDFAAASGQKGSPARVDDWFSQRQAEGGASAAGAAQGGAGAADRGRPAGRADGPTEGPAILGPHKERLGAERPRVPDVPRCPAAVGTEAPQAQPGQENEAPAPAEGHAAAAKPRNLVTSWSAQAAGKAANACPPAGASWGPRADAAPTCRSSGAAAGEAGQVRAASRHQNAGRGAARRRRPRTLGQAGAAPPRRRCLTPGFPY